jgi:hypothetical protein
MTVEDNHPEERRGRSPLFVKFLTISPHQKRVPLLCGALNLVILPASNSRKVNEEGFRTLQRGIAVQDFVIPKDFVLDADARNLAQLKAVSLGDGGDGRVVGVLLIVTAAVRLDLNAIVAASDGVVNGIGGIVISHFFVLLFFFLFLSVIILPQVCPAVKSFFIFFLFLFSVSLS